MTKEEANDFIYAMHPTDNPRWPLEGLVLELGWRAFRCLQDEFTSRTLRKIGEADPDLLDPSKVGINSWTRPARK